MIIIWNDTEIGGHKCASVTIDDKRLYVAERFGRIEAWIDTVKIGNYADFAEAKAAVLKIRRPTSTESERQVSKRSSTR
jgi:hypothetical protein